MKKANPRKCKSCGKKVARLRSSDLCEKCDDERIRADRRWDDICWHLGIGRFGQ